MSGVDIVIHKKVCIECVQNSQSQSIRSAIYLCKRCGAIRAKMDFAGRIGVFHESLGEQTAITKEDVAALCFGFFQKKRIEHFLKGKNYFDTQHLYQDLSKFLDDMIAGATQPQQNEFVENKFRYRFMIGIALFVCCFIILVFVWFFTVVLNPLL